MKYLLIAILAFELVSCSRTTEKKSTSEADSLKENQAVVAGEIDYESFTKLESYLVTNDIDTAKIQRIDFDCAVLVNPTDEQIEKMKKDEGEENFATIVDDSNYYQGLAIEKIDSVGVKQEVATRQYLRLVGGTTTWTLDVRKQNMPEWNIIFFTKNKAPIIVRSIDLTTEKVRGYFK